MSLRRKDQGAVYCPKCGLRNCRHGLPLVTFKRLQEIHNGTGGKKRGEG